MSKAFDNYDGPKASPSNSDEESEAAKSSRAHRRRNAENNERYEIDDSYYSNPRRHSREIVDFESVKLRELKYKNLYSMSVPNGRSTFRNSRRTAGTIAASPISSEIVEITTNLFNEKFDDAKYENVNGYFLDDIREYLANYQESYGTSRDEYSFVSLMKTMGQATGQSLVAIFYIVVNVLPLIQLFLFILRFVVDKLISIRNTGCNQQSIVKYAIFGGQLACIYVCLVFIYGFVVMPILHLVIAILAKILLIN